MDPAKRCQNGADVALEAITGVVQARQLCEFLEISLGNSILLSCPVGLGSHVKAHLADYKAPRELVLAPVGRAPNGKLDYKAIRTRALEALGQAAG